MPLYIIIIIIFFSLVFFKVRKLNSLSLLKMKFWLIFSYSFLILTHIFSGIKYNAGDPLRVLPYLIICLSLLLIGDKIGRSVNKKYYFKRKKIKLSKLTISSIFGSIIYTFDLIRLNSISFGLRIEDLQISIFGVLGNILASLGIIVWLMSFYENRLYNLKIPLFSYLALMSYLSGGILSAGRQAIILVLLSTSIMFLWGVKKRKELKLSGIKYEKRKRSLPIGLIIISSLFVSYFIYISNFRSQILDIDNKLDMFERGFNAQISNETAKDVYNLDPYSDIYIEGLFYYSHQLNRLDLIYEYYDHYPLMGLSQFNYIERRLQWLFGKQADISWKKVVLAIEQKGNFSSHTWGTVVTNYIIDFGRFGALFAFFITGYIIGIINKCLVMSESPVRIIQHCLILAGIVFSIQFSPFTELIWAFPLFLLSFIKIDASKKQTIY